MTILNVQFSDSTETRIVSYFASPQIDSVFANLGTVDTSDPRWLTFYDALPAGVGLGIPAPD